MRRHKILLGVVAGLLMVGAVVGGVALAQDPATPTPNPTPRFGFGRGGMMGRMWGKGGGGAGGGFGGMLGFGRRGLGDGSGLLGVVADTLKMTPADVMAEWAKGKTLRQVVKDHQGDPNGIVDKVVADRKAGLDQAVTAGSLTQDQENVVLQNLKTQLNAELDLLGMNMPEVPGMRRGGHGGMMGGWGRGLQFNPGRLFRFGTQSS